MLVEVFVVVLLELPVDGFVLVKYELLTYPVTFPEVIFDQPLLVDITVTLVPFTKVVTLS